MSRLEAALRGIAAELDVLEVLPGLSVPVARSGDLIALKLLSEGPRRPQDAGDLAALLAQADDGDLRRAREMAVMIVERGFNRGRDLPSRLQERMKLHRE